MNKIYQNVLEQLSEIVLKKTNKFRQKIVKLVNNIEVEEYEIDNKLYYSDGNIIYENTKSKKPIGFKNKDIFYIFSK